MKYFYIDGQQKLGPFSLGELENENLSRDTKIWFFGLENWKKISEVDELKFLIEHIPPEIKLSQISRKKETHYSSPGQKNIYKKFSTKKNLLIGLGLLITFFLGYFYVTPNEDQKFYNGIAESSYDSDINFQPYINKYYRDAEVFGLYPQKPKTTIIRFAKLDQLKNTTHLHGVSYGYEDDDKIEIYINPSTWEKFNKPMRYFLIYHELSHDILNVDDLEMDVTNEGKLMYPAISSFETLTMDDFIHSSHHFFEEVSGNSLTDNF